MVVRLATCQNTNDNLFISDQAARDKKNDGKKRHRHRERERLREHEIWHGEEATIELQNCKRERERERVNSVIVLTQSWNNQLHC